MRRRFPHRRPAAASTAAQPLRFTFDGRAYHGLRRRHARLGAARQRRASRRPLVQVSPPARHPRRGRRGAERAGRRSARTRRATTPNLRATQVELYDGLERDSQNRWPSLAFDVGARQRPALAVHSRRLLLQDLHVAARRLEARLRAADPRAAGLGVRPPQPDPDRYTNRYAHCDVLVVGAGPAGLAAALAAAATRRAGHPLRRAGRARRHRCCPSRHRRVSDRRLPRHATGCADALAQLARCPNVTLLPRTTAFGYFPHNHRRPGRAADRPSGQSAAGRCRASGSGRCARRRWCSRPAPSSGRWCFRATTGPASCWPAPRAPIVNRYGVLPGHRGSGRRRPR